MPLTVLCICRHRSVWPEGRRGIEEECPACGRIFRLPAEGELLDLAIPAATDDFLRLAAHTPNAKLGLPGRRARKARRRGVLAVAALALGAALALLIALAN